MDGQSPHPMLPPDVKISRLGPSRPRIASCPPLGAKHFSSSLSYLILRYGVIPLLDESIRGPRCWAMSPARPAHRRPSYRLSGIRADMVSLPQTRLCWGAEEVSWASRYKHGAESKEGSLQAALVASFWCHIQHKGVIMLIVFLPGQKEKQPRSNK